MSLLLFGNNFATTLVSSITDTDTSADLVSVTGLPVISGDQYYVLSLFDAATQLITEIIHVTARSGNIVTIVRAQEGTTALDWAAGSIVSWEWTAGQAGAMVQQFQMQAQAGNYAVGSGTNTITAAFTPALTSHLIGAPLRILIENTNTGAVTFNPDGVSAVAVTGPNGSALIAGDLVAGDIVEFLYNGTSYLAQVVQASTTRIGVTRLATVAEAEAGASQSIAVTPAGLAGALAAINGVLPASGQIWYADTPPAGYLELDGSSLNTTTYAAIFAELGYTWGGSGSSFSLPDTRGYFLRGWANTGSIDPGRDFASVQAAAFAAHSHLNGAAGVQSDPYVYTATTSGMPGTATNVFQKENATPTFQGNTSTVGGSDTHPVNIAIMFIIKI